MTDDTPTIYCTRTNRLIDTCLPGQEGPETKLARHMKDYGPDLIVLPFNEAWQRHEDAAKSAPVEITEARFHEMLNILPPVAWHSTADGESFKMSERITGLITTIFVRIGSRHFEFADSIRLRHVDCCKRVAESDAFLNSTPPTVT